MHGYQHLLEQYIHYIWLLLLHFYAKVNPQKNILTLSKKCFGKFIGSILNIVFLLYFLLLTTAIAFQVCLIKGTLIVRFLSITKNINSNTRFSCLYCNKRIKGFSKNKSINVYKYYYFIFNFDV